MNLQSIKIKNIGLIAVFVLGSMTSIGYTASVAISYNDVASQQASINSEIGKELTTSCQANLDEMASIQKVVIQKTKDGFRGVSNYKISDPYPMLTSISSAIQSCNGYRLKEFCMGSDCETALSFELVGVNNEA